MRTRTVRFSTLMIDEVDVPIQSGRLVLVQNEVDASSLSGMSTIDGTRSWHADIALANHQAVEDGTATFGTDEGPANGEVLAGSASIGRSVSTRLEGTGPLEGLTWP